MKLQDQVITIEQAKRLKELGVNADSLFMWVVPATTPTDYWEEAEREMYPKWDASLPVCYHEYLLNYLKQHYSLVKKSKDEGDN